MKVISKILTNCFTMFFCLLLLNCGGNKYNWWAKYADEKDHVYGTYIIKRYLNNLSTAERKEIDTKIAKYFDEEEQHSGNYFFMGDAMLVDDADAEALASFVEKGNQAFISTKVFPNSISKIIFEPCMEKPDVEDNEEYYWEDEEDEIFLDTVQEEPIERWRDLDFDHLNFADYYAETGVMSLDAGMANTIQTSEVFMTFKNTGPRYREWFYLHDSLACLAYNDINVLGYIDQNKINFFEISYGEGSFFIHTNPLVFTNVNMLDNKTADYIVHTLNSEMSTSEWHWDDFSRTNMNLGRSRNRGRTLIDNKGPLTFILQQAPLKWAWYSLLAMGGFFILFRAKRKQRVVPVLPEKENTSLSFVNTIGNLYFHRNDHKKLCQDQMQLWLEDIRHHYRINTSLLDEKFVTLLSAKSKKSKKEIQNILDYYNNIENGGFVSENTMVTFYQKLNEFNIQTKS